MLVRSCDNNNNNDARYNFLAELEECHNSGQSGASFLKSLLEKWNKPDADKVNAARVKVDQIKQVMIQNIQKALVRGAALSELEDRSVRSTPLL